MIVRQRLASLDAALCAAAFLGTWISTFGPGAYRMSVAPSLFLSAAATLVVWSSSRFPIASFSFAAVTTLLLPAIDAAFEAMGIVLALVAYQVVRKLRRHVGVFAVLAFLLMQIHDLWVRHLLHRSFLEPSAMQPLLLASFAIGLGWQTRQVEMQNTELVRLRQRDRELAVADERRRIANDIHDVAAHHLSALIVRNQLAQRVGSTVALQNAAEFSADTASEALNSLRHVVGVLNTEERGPRDPSPSLADVNGIVERVRAAGLSLDATISLSGQYPREIEIAGTRIIQEALANVLRHRGPGNAWLRVTETHGLLDVIVEDDGPSAWTDRPRSDGYGLVGMQERARSCGGKLEIGSSERGGWKIHALLPVTRT